MVTGVVESGYVKCYKYWPEAGETFSLCRGSLTIVGREIEDKGHVVRHFDVSKNGESRRVVQYHHTTWPDGGVPASTEGLLSYLSDLEDWNTTSGGGPIIVHCSAGIGRTGTLIVLSSQIKRLLATGTVNVAENIKQVRRQRNYLVQGAAQYQLIFEALALVARRRSEETSRRTLASPNETSTSSNWLE